MKTVLITGGSGLIGKGLSEQLLAKGYQVSILSRTENSSTHIKSYHWDIERATIDPNAIASADIIIHLAGEGIADKRWSKSRKAAIINSRVNSTNLLFTELAKGNHHVQAFISSSAIGFYGNRGEELLLEESLAGTGFLSESCKKWEEAVDRISELNIRLVKLRTGIVLSKEGGALPKMAQPISFGLGSALGNGKQWMSWIHEKDLCSLYIFALENSNISGTYNATTLNPTRNKDFLQTLANVMHKPFYLPSVPEFILKIVLGEMSAIVLDSTKVSSKKITSEGFKFEFIDLQKSFINLGYLKK